MTAILHNNILLLNVHNYYSFLLVFSSVKERLNLKLSVYGFSDNMYRRYVVRVLV